MAQERLDAKTKEQTWSTTDAVPELMSETHAAHFVDIDGDGLKDLVTGKRWWSPRPRRARLELAGPDRTGSRPRRTPTGITSFSPMLIDDDSGIGTQFAVADINGDGLLDIISSNKKGVQVIVQQRK